MRRGGGGIGGRVPALRVACCAAVVASILLTAAAVDVAPSSIVEQHERLRRRVDELERAVWSRTEAASSHSYPETWSSQAVARIQTRVGEYAPPLDTTLEGSRRRRHSQLMYSQSGEDAALDYMFRGARNGTFLEMGALDGRHASNSHFFERELGWVGVLIEPSPSPFSKLKRNRPGNVLINAAVCGPESANRTRALLAGEYGAFARKAGCGIGAVHFVEGSRPAVRGIMEFMEPAFLHKWHPKSALGQRRLSCVPCRGLSELLAPYGVRYVDFFSLDVEGAEHEVLKTVDFDEFRPRVLFLEAPLKDAERERLLVTLLKVNDYHYMGKKARSLWFVDADREGWQELKNRWADAFS